MTALTTYYPVVMSVLDMVAEGYTLTHACQLKGTTVTTFRRALRSSPELKELFEEAEQNGSDVLADMLLRIGDPSTPYGHGDPAKMKVMSDNIKWLLSRRKPTQYGDKVTVQHNITADAAIVDALARGRQRATSLQIEDVPYEVVETVAEAAFDPNEFG